MLFPADYDAALRSLIDGSEKIYNRVNAGVFFY
jgi:hypothetical protein